MVISQLDGLITGYNQNAPSKHKLTHSALVLLNQWRDVVDVLYALSPNVPKKLFDIVHLPRGLSAAKIVTTDMSVRGESENESENEELKQAQQALPRVQTDILVGHVSMSGYWNMLRIFKHFRFGVAHNATAITSASQPAIEYSMASYPGTLTSGDDFFISRRGFVMMSSSLPLLRRSLYQHIKPSESVLTWMRCVIAARMESTQSALHALSLFNSGTDSRQWMVLDVVQDAQRAPSAWILDLVPGDSRSTDVTAEFSNRTFLFSANRPLSSHVARRIGLEHYRNRYGEEFSHDGEARAVMLQRELASVASAGDLMKVLRSNKYKEDPGASNDPDNAIAPRYDLKGDDMQWYGAIDAKVTSSFLLGQHVCLGVSGPSTSGGTLPPVVFPRAPDTNPYAVRSLDDTISNHLHDPPSHHGIAEDKNLEYSWMVLAPAAAIREATGFNTAAPGHVGVATTTVSSSDQ